MCATEPELQPLTGERLNYRRANPDEGDRLDVQAKSFWGPDNQTALIDVILSHQSVGISH